MGFYSNRHTFGKYQTQDAVRENHAILAHWWMQYHGGEPIVLSWSIGRIAAAQIVGQRIESFAGLRTDVLLDGGGTILTWTWARTSF